MAASNQVAILPALTLIAGMGAAAALAVWLYRSRGFLGVWTAAVVAGLVTDAMAARSLEDPALLQLSNGVFTIVTLLALAGGWGLAQRRARFRIDRAAQTTDGRTFWRTRRGEREYRLYLTEVLRRCPGAWRQRGVPQMSGVRRFFARLRALSQCVDDLDGGSQATFRLARIVGRGPSVARRLMNRGE